VLEEAAIEIAKLKEHIDQMTPELEVTKKDVEKTMNILSHDRAEADEEKEIVAKDEAEATQQEAEAEQLKREAELELSKATPLLDEAARVLKELKKDDFYSLSAIKKPTATVVLGMEISCIMMGLKPKKTNLGKVDGDTNGFFDLARLNLLNNPGKFMQ
jgi:phosphoglycolate phosphatase-like HAD superfamily hydrolase